MIALELEIALEIQNVLKRRILRENHLYLITYKESTRTSKLSITSNLLSIVFATMH